LKTSSFCRAGASRLAVGAARNVTLFNCFVMGPIEGSMRGIFAALQEAAVTMQQGGGIGCDFSTLLLRARGPGGGFSAEWRALDVARVRPRRCRLRACTLRGSHRRRTN
jgi:ribonucleoside-diphosphate reductase alpha chain